MEGQITYKKTSISGNASLLRLTTPLKKLGENWVQLKEYAARSSIRSWEFIELTIFIA